ncbi:MAG: hypothetical protein QM765_48365 [Myxococcales bacterium]
MPINAEWHRKNRMPKNPTTEQRIAWHEAHARACQCRPVPEKLAELIAARGAGGSVRGGKTGKAAKARKPRSS